MPVCIIFPFLFGGTFIEGTFRRYLGVYLGRRFPFLFGGTFIEGPVPAGRFLITRDSRFPFLFGGTFIEGAQQSRARR